VLHGGFWYWQMALSQAIKIQSGGFFKDIKSFFKKNP